VALADPSAGFFNIVASWLAGSRRQLVNVNTMPASSGDRALPHALCLPAGGAGFRNSDAAMEEARAVSGAGPMKLLRTIDPAAAAAGAARCAAAGVIMSAGDFIIPVDDRPQGADLHDVEPDLAELELVPGPARAGRGAGTAAGRCGAGLHLPAARALSRGARFTLLGGKGSAATRSRSASCAIRSPRWRSRSRSARRSCRCSRSARWPS
jgi:hypothetical protein